MSFVFKTEKDAAIIGIVNNNFLKQALRPEPMFSKRNFYSYTSEIGADALYFNFV